MIAHSTRPLAEFATRSHVTVKSIDAALAEEVRAYLSAWGITPGVTLTVLGQHPVTRIAIEHAELALEREVARQIACELVKPAGKH